jgi:CrcB protein
MKIFLFILLASLGAYSRWLLTWLDNKFFSSSPFSIGVLAANVLGALLIGWLYTSHKLDRSAFLNTYYILLSVALLGSFTTFSAYILDTLKLIQNGQGLWALVHVLVTNGMCLGFCLLGSYLAEKSY